MTCSHPDRISPAWSGVYWHSRKYWVVPRARTTPSSVSGCPSYLPSMRIEKPYLVRETKGTKDFLKLGNSEADKVRCGKQHFEALGVNFDVVVNASEV
jgi:hypothetical protein